MERCGLEHLLGEVRTTSAAIGLMGRLLLEAPGNCRSCNTSVDCYTGLIVPHSVCSPQVDGSSIRHICSCLPGGGGSRCTPGTPKMTTVTATGETSSTQKISESTSRSISNDYVSRSISLSMSTTDDTRTVTMSSQSATHSKSRTTSRSSSGSANSTDSPTSIGSGSISTSVMSTDTATSTPSLSCDPNSTAVGNATLRVLLPSGAASQEEVAYPQGSSLPVAQLAGSTRLVVQVAASAGVVFSKVSSVRVSVGEHWAAALDNATGDVIVSGTMSSTSIGTLTLVSNSAMSFAADIDATGRCLPPGYRESVVLTWTLTPVPRPSTLHAITTTTFRASAAVSGALGNPLTAMTMTGVISIQTLSECLYSDIDALDPSVSPTGAAMGPELGQYYRGGAGTGLALYGGITVFSSIAAQVLKQKLDVPLTTAFARLHLPSVGMIIVAAFGQGMASCGVSLIRLNFSFGDVVLGIVSLAVCCLVVLLALNITTRGLQGRVVIERSKDTVAEVPRQLQWFLKLSTWKMHWKDTSATQFKKRYMMLIDDLQRPWWMAAELSSCLFQGSVLGIRANSLSTCRNQQWVLVVHTLGMTVAAVWYRPCGAHTSNMFLVASKLFALIVALMTLLNTVTLDDTYATAAQAVTSIATAVGSCQTLIQVLTMAITLLPRAQRWLFRWRRRHLVVAAPYAARGEVPCSSAGILLNLVDIAADDDPFSLDRAELPSVMPMHQENQVNAAVRDDVGGLAEPMLVNPHSPLLSSPTHSNQRTKIIPARKAARSRRKPALNEDLDGRILPIDEHDRSEEDDEEDLSKIERLRDELEYFLKDKDAWRTI